MRRFLGEVSEIPDGKPRGGKKIFGKPLDKNDWMVYNICVRGYSLMVKLQLPKLATRVRFPLPAP